MDAKKLLQKYYSRLTMEGWLKSLFLGLVVGFSALFISAAVCWYVGIKGIWVCVLVLLAVACGAIPIFFFKLYRPSIKQVAQRVDALGLEERLLTMVELEKEVSFIANAQREDAKKSAENVHERLLKIVVPVSLIVSMSVVGACGIGMTTVAALSKTSGEEFINEIITPEPNRYEITYEVDGDGMIEGDIVQVIDEGQNGQQVVAVADPGWVFVGWSDEQLSDKRQESDPCRIERAVDRNKVVTAVFKEMEDPDDGDEGDSEMDAEELFNEGSGSNNKIDPNVPPSGSGGRYEPNNQLIDGNTPLEDIYSDAYEDAMDDISDLPSDDGNGDIAKDYMDTIKP